MVRARVETSDGIAIDFEAAPAEYEEALATTLRAIRRAVRPVVSQNQGPTRAQLQQMVEKLNAETIEYLRLLVRSPDGLTDGEITKSLGIEERQKLAGMNGAVTKTTASVGMDDVDIIHREVARSSDGSRTYHYRIPNDIRQKLDQVLPEEPEPSPRIRTPPPPSDDDVPF